jgi:CRP-like cAMP-binding protein
VQQEIAMAVRKYEKGEVIFAEGSASTEAYIIRSGRVEIFKNSSKGSVILSVLGEGDMFGEMGLLDDRPRSASAKAADSVVISVIPLAELTDEFLISRETALSLLRALFERLRAMNLLLMARQAPKLETSASVPQVFLFPMTPETVYSLPEEGQEVTRLPFRIGRRPSPHEPDVIAFNEIQLIDREPFRVSLNHFSLDLEGGEVVARDRGSRFGTVVDDIVLGSGEMRDSLPLGYGPHEIIAGPRDSPYRIKVMVKPGDGHGPT